MEQAEIVEQVIKVVTEVLRSKKALITTSSRIKDDLGADSLDRMALLMALEDAFKQQISDEEAQKLVTIGDVVEFVHSRTKEKNN